MKAFQVSIFILLSIISIALIFIAINSFKTPNFSFTGDTINENNYILEKKNTTLDEGEIEIEEKEGESIEETKIVCEYPYIRHAEGCCLDENDNLICDVDEPQKEINLSKGTINYHENFLVYNYSEGNSQAFLIYNARLDNELLEPNSSIIVLENANEEGYQELKEYFSEKGIYQLIILQEDYEIGVAIKKFINIAIMVKGKIARN